MGLRTIEGDRFAGSHQISDWIDVGPHLCVFGSAQTDIISRAVICCEPDYRAIRRELFENLNGSLDNSGMMGDGIEDAASEGLRIPARSSPLAARLEGPSGQLRNSTLVRSGLGR